VSENAFLPPPAAWPARLAGMTLAALMIAGAVQMPDAVHGLSQRALPSSYADFMEGRTTAALEKALAEGLPAREAAIAIANGLRYRLLGGTPESVRAGHDGTLFLTEEMVWHRDGWNNQSARVALLAQVSQRLHQQGVTLLVTLVPDKARMLQGQVRGGYPEELVPRYARAVTSLRKAGVAVVALDGALSTAQDGTARYYRSDTHWNQDGARAAAVQIATQMRATAPLQGHTSFRTEATGKPEVRVGDLVKMMGLADAPDWLRPPIDVETPARTVDTAPSNTGAGLFGNATVPVVLVGTSYSLRANFHGYLQEALGVNVLNAARDGGGFLQATEDYLRNDAFTSDKPQMIIWELPERFLQAPLKDESGFLVRTGLAPCPQKTSPTAVSDCASKIF
jgi:alginate O-acetyltransferase complex protein AlgJ